MSLRETIRAAGNAEVLEYYGHKIRLVFYYGDTKKRVTVNKAASLFYRNLYKDRVPWIEPPNPYPTLRNRHE